MTTNEHWIAATRPRSVSDTADDSAIPDAVMDDPRFSLIAKGLYSLVLAHQGQPMNPNEDAIEDVEDVRVAVEELVDAGLVVRVAAS